MADTPGGLSIANNLLANEANLNETRSQAKLKGTVEKLSTGLRINSAADDPSGLAIAETLQTQVSGFDAAVRSIQDGRNAATVAEGALQTITDILQRIRSMAVEASTDLASTADKANLQTEVGQLLLEVNHITQDVTFNGVPLLDGSHAGFTPGELVNLAITSNSALATDGGLAASANNFPGFLVASVSVASAAGYMTMVDGTIEVQVVNTGTSVAAQATFINSASGVVSVDPALYAPNQGFATLDNVSVMTGTFTTADVGVTAFIKVQQFIAPSSNPFSPALFVQSSFAEGGVIQIAFPVTNTQTLRISNINLLLSSPNSASLGAEDAIGQVDFALQRLLAQRANLGAIMVRLAEDSDNDNIASVNLTQSKSAIWDFNIGQGTTELAKDQVLTQIGQQMIASSNTNAQTVEQLLNNPGH